MVYAVLLPVLAGLTGTFLQGCGGGEVTTTRTTTTTTTTSTTTTTTTLEAPQPMPDSDHPIKGICYAALPCFGPGNCGVGYKTPEDMSQPGFENLWGAKGRNDLSIMKAMGANTIRLYHPIGYWSDPGHLAPEPDHSILLDAAKDNRLNVFAAIHQSLPCDAQDNCFVSWKKAVENGLRHGFAVDTKGGGQQEWHSAVWAINMINEVDAMVPSPNFGKQYVKRIISAVDGLLAAERDVGVKGNVNLTSCFTTAIATPLGGGVATVYHGFSSMEAWMKDPLLVPYAPQSGMSIKQLTEEVNRRWVHCMNAQIPWKALRNMVAPDYLRLGYPRPWIIGEMGFNGEHADKLTDDLVSMNDYASNKSTQYLGSFFFQFQTAYFKSGPELNYGMFGLGHKPMGYDVTTTFYSGYPDPKTSKVHKYTYPVQCLTSRLWVFEQNVGCKEKCNHRAQAVAEAFGGTLAGPGLCLQDPPLPPNWNPPAAAQDNEMKLLAV